MTTMISKENNPLLALAEKPGFEGLKELAETLQRIGERKRDHGGKLVLPNFFLKCNEGYNLEEILLRLEEVLEEYDLMNFSGPVKHYQISLDYSLPNAPDFPAFSVLFDSVENELSRFNHPYEGILVVDISDWVAHSAISEKKFLDFLLYMAEVDERTLAIYVDMSGLDSQSDLAYRSLITKTRLERIELKIVSEEVALSLLKDELAEFGFVLSEDAEEVIKPTLKTILSTKGNEGPLTLHQLAEDIVYHAYKDAETFSRQIGVPILKPFLNGGEWLNEFADKKRFYLGLVGE